MGTVIVIVILAACITGAVISIVKTRQKAKRNGGVCCSCGCSDCRSNCNSKCKLEEIK